MPRTGSSDPEVIGGGNLTLINQAAGVIDGNGTTAPLVLDTNGTLFGLSHTIGNAGVIAGTTTEGVIIVSNVSNEGILEALGTNARLVIDGGVTNVTGPLGRTGLVRALGVGAHVDLSSAEISGGSLQVGNGSLVDTLAGSGLSIISNVIVSNAGTLEANSSSELLIQGSNVGTTGTLMSNGAAALLDVNGSVGAVSATINGGEIEFDGASAANVAFAAGAVGTLKLDATFTGTISGFAGVSPNVFSQFIGFGDSSIDSGAFQYLSTGNPNIDARIQNALANGGTASPVGVGLMNSQLLAGDLGLTANSAYAPGGGTNYAISGSLDAAFAGNGDTGNSINNTLPSTAAQISNYLTAAGQADPNALYLISSGGNDISYALNTFPGDVASQDAYVAAAAQQLTTAIVDLFAAGAQYVMVDNNLSDKSLAEYYSTQLFDDLNASGVPYIQGDVHSMLDTVKANPTAFGLDPNETLPGVQGTGTEFGFDRARHHRFTLRLGSVGRQHDDARKFKRSGRSAIRLSQFTERGADEPVLRRSASVRGRPTHPGELRVQHSGQRQGDSAGRPRPHRHQLRVGNHNGQLCRQRHRRHADGDGRREHRKHRAAGQLPGVDLYHGKRRRRRHAGGGSIERRPAGAPGQAARGVMT